MPEYPEALQELIALCEQAGEAERREILHAFAQSVDQFCPQQGRTYTYADERKDEGCTDTVGIFLSVSPKNETEFAVSFGPQVQTLTRALGYVLCKGLQNTPLDQIADLSGAFVPRLVGETLVRLRSQTVYYVLDRMKEATRAVQSAQADSSCQEPSQP